MGEIKSTLDLIMERTRNLSLSEEEKEEIRARELKGRLRGLVQKRLEGTLSVSHLRSEIEAEKRKGLQIDKPLLTELVSRIEPDGENERVFEIMEEVACLESAPFRKIVLECRQDMARQRERSAEALGSALKGRGISGPAVLPNPAADPGWRSAREARRRACREELSAIADTRTTTARSSGNSP